jgi:hypothetical protein
MTITDPKGEDPNKTNKTSFRDKFKESYHNLKKNERMEGFYNYASSNTKDMIAYVLLLFGLLLLFIEPPWYGETLIGVIFGLYFGYEILGWIKDYKETIESFGYVKALILGGVLLALFIEAPFIFIGAAAAIALRQFILSDKKEP